MITPIFGRLPVNKLHNHLKHVLARLVTSCMHWAPCSVTFKICIFAHRTCTVASFSTSSLQFSVKTQHDSKNTNFLTLLHFSAHFIHFHSSNSSNFALLGPPKICAAGSRSLPPRTSGRCLDEFPVLTQAPCPQFCIHTTHKSIENRSRCCPLLFRLVFPAKFLDFRVHPL